jgi:hypothetical protein
MRRLMTGFALTMLAFSAISVAGNVGESAIIGALEPRLAHLKLKSDDFRLLVARQIITRSLATKNSKEIAGLSLMLADAAPDTFIDSYRSLKAFRQNRYMLAFGRFSTTPVLEDLSQLIVDDNDLLALANCRLNESDIKLSEQDIGKFQSTSGPVSTLTAKLKMRLASEYKRLLLDRVKAYLAKGSATLASFADKEDSVDAREVFASLAREQAGQAEHCEHLYGDLERYPEASGTNSESFVYWAKQRFGSLKPVINLVHVLIHRDGHRTFVASKQIYSSHYTEGGLSVAELIPFTDEEGQTRTMVVYSIRLQVDMLGGILGSMKKRLAQPRMLATLRESLSGMRETMEAKATRHTATQ